MRRVRDLAAVLALPLVELVLVVLAFALARVVVLLPLRLLVCIFARLTVSASSFREEPAHGRLHRVVDGRPLHVRRPRVGVYDRPLCCLPLGNAEHSLRVVRMHELQQVKQALEFAHLPHQQLQRGDYGLS